MPARVLALVAAVAMVAGALAVRARLDDREASSAAPLRLLCATELATACERLASRDRPRLESTVEAAGDTAARLATAREPDFDAWLVPGPWPELVAASRQRGGLTPMVASGPVVARSPLVLAVWDDRSQVLGRRCPERELGWRCLGEVAGAPWSDLGGRPIWGPVKPGHADPTKDATGLVVLGAAAAGFFGRTDFSRADIEEDDGFRQWLGRLERAVPTFRPSGGTPLEDMLIKGPAAFDVVGTTEAEARPLLEAAARSELPRLLYPAPVRTADVVVATVPGPRSEQLARLLGGDAGGEVLAGSGWRVGGRAGGGGPTPPLPTTSGLPEPGVLEALTEAWREVTR